MSSWRMRYRILSEPTVGGQMPYSVRTGLGEPYAAIGAHGNILGECMWCANGVLCQSSRRRHAVYGVNWVWPALHAGEPNYAVRCTRQSIDPQMQGSCLREHRRGSIRRHASDHVVERVRSGRNKKYVVVGSCNQLLYPWVCFAEADESNLMRRPRPLGTASDLAQNKECNDKREPGVG